MRLTESTAGKAHTTDEDYAKFSGQLVMTVSTTNYDPKRKCWIKRTYEYIDIGRADPVTPIDPDAELQYEKFERKCQSNLNWEVARDRNKALGEAARAKRRDRIVEELREWGPSTLVQISESLSIPRATVNDLMQIYKGTTFCIVGKKSGSGQAALWGLVGVHDKEAA